MLRSIVLFTLAYIVGSSCTVRALCPLYSKDYNTIWPRQGEARIETAFIDYCPSVSGASVGATLSGQSSSEDYSFKAPSSYRSADGSYTLVCRYTYPTEDLDGVEVFRKRADTTYDCTYTGGGSQSLTPAASNDQNECPTIQADAAEPSAGFSRRQAEKRATKLTYVCARKPEYLTNDADTSINVDEIYLLTATIRKGSFASAGTDGSFEYDCNYHTQDTATGETCSYTWDSVSKDPHPVNAQTGPA
ncbi:uncharacterized protein I303_103088 [Kwoniella dejecticola CBS 10117]|uniref:Ig-like domain-containing protein n=1 Tax=Kwoniella dejecticola CBS 10117 TaxID=1296121 RepID=A0A1A6AAL3_9TREE|nr:uncharacterized protein I303_03108 [Kwoniella dejecticola CBS 10117]OBR87085.1 hypothetical protein I303_03108 [Kwoniella dejecticola CBS 10117]